MLLHLHVCKYLCVCVCLYGVRGISGSQARNITSSRWSQGRWTLLGSHMILIASCTTPGTPSHGKQWFEFQRLWYAKIDFVIDSKVWAFSVLCCCCLVWFVYVSSSLSFRAQTSAMHKLNTLPDLHSNTTRNTVNQRGYNCQLTIFRCPAHTSKASFSHDLYITSGESGWDPVQSWSFSHAVHSRK